MVQLVFHLLIEGNAFISSRGFLHRKRNNCIIFLITYHNFNKSQRSLEKRGKRGMANISVQQYKKVKHYYSQIHSKCEENQLSSKL
jgi:hypothetical protein